MKYGKKLVLFTLFAMNLVDQPAPEVEIEQGRLSGIVNSKGTILEYIGIPYGTVDSSNRFQAPLPPPKWEGVYKATEEYNCPQHTDISGVLGTEDCLKVNVYVPVGAKSPIPVMVFIHGGAFVLGSGGKLMYGPDFLVKHDVILVTFNYRLGALGFLCLGIKEAPGNAGIKDQIAALRWIKKNIAAFGGDPDNITIFGESAGGTSTSILLAIEATEGLFNRAIVQSGSSIASWAVNRNPVWVASLLTKAIGHETEDPYEIYEILSKLSYKELISIKTPKPLEWYFDTQLLHLPCIEKPFPGVEPAINDVPYNLLRNKPKNISVIYGSNDKEALFLLHDESDETLEDRNYMYLFASDLDLPSHEEALKVNEKIKKFYFGNERISMKNLMKTMKLYTHLYFELPEVFETDLLLNSSNAPVYNYYFKYAGGRNFLKHRRGYANESGACHADELMYQFNSLLWPYAIKEKDQKVIDWMTTLWTNFAKYGDPTPSFKSDLPVKWIPSQKNHLNFLYIDEQLSLGPMPNPEAYKLWNDIYMKYRKLNKESYW